ncbi:MAG TPA: hypothetical protein VLJ84_08205, partial [Usitatibacter sp.]|nr:hypothetical protein [Usitatibacter sp.]
LGRVAVAAARASGVRSLAIQHGILYPKYFSYRHDADEAASPLPDRSIRAGRLASALFDRGVSVHPIVYPAVAENAARLRFFLSASHAEEQILLAVEALASACRET